MERDRPGAGPVVQGFGPAGFRIDGELFRGALLSAVAVRSWAPPALDALTVESLAPVLDPKPEFVLLGTGLSLRRPPSWLVAALADRDVGLEAMDSRAAARAWGVLRGEGRPIAAALYPLDS
jgi:uncharacterized protein